VLGAHAFVVRFFGRGGDDRLLVVNLGHDEHFSPAPEPLLAPPTGGAGRCAGRARPRLRRIRDVPARSADGWRLPGESAVLLAPSAEGEEPAGEPWPELDRDRRAAPTIARGRHEGSSAPLPWPGEERAGPDLLTREWLVTNGLGGYASGTVAASPPAASRPARGLPAVALRAHDDAQRRRGGGLPSGRDLPSPGGEEHEETQAPLPARST
jgi:hypothetical protein